MSFFAPLCSPSDSCPDNLRYTISTCLFAVPRAVSNGTVAAKCNIDKVCKSLKEPLTGDELIPNTSNAFSYCTANDGAFMGSGLESCIDCLQDTLDETYISNCKSKPFQRPRAIIRLIICSPNRS